MAFRNLTLVVEGRVSVLTVNRPEVRNALDTETVSEFHRALDEVREARSTVLIVTGAGDKAFVSGADINAMIGNEAFLMLQEGVATAEDIDKALKLGLNHPMGPFEMVDLVGLDTRLAVLEFLHKSLGEKYKPAPLLVQHVKAGRLGRKVGRGVYDYGNG